MNTRRSDAPATALRMTAQILAAELGNLIQDSKRKNTELKNAAEKALQDLKSLSVTSEAQLAAGEYLSVAPAVNACTNVSQTYLDDLTLFPPF